MKGQLLSILIRQVKASCVYAVVSKSRWRIKLWKRMNPPKEK